MHAKQNPGDVPPGFFAFLGLLHIGVVEEQGHIIILDPNVRLIIGRFRKSIKLSV